MSEDIFNELREGFFKKNGRYPTVSELRAIYFEYTKDERNNSIDMATRDIGLTENVSTSKPQIRITSVNKKALKKDKLSLKQVVVSGMVVLTLLTAIVATNISHSKPAYQAERELGIHYYVREEGEHMIDPRSEHGCVLDGTIEGTAKGTVVERVVCYLEGSGIDSEEAYNIVSEFFTKNPHALEKSEYLTEENFKNVINEIVNEVYYRNKNVR